LFTHEAEWGKRLRDALGGLSPYDQFCFVTLYAFREVKAYYREENEAFTTDLDTILTYKPWPWFPENIHAFNMAALARPDSLADWVLTGKIGGTFPRFTWDEISGSHFLPWHHRPKRDDPRNHQELLAIQANDAALRFWMGTNPLFLPPLGHEELGLPDLTMPVITQLLVNKDHGPEANPRFVVETHDVRQNLNTTDQE